jgi:hypothetical protein
MAFLIIPILAIMTLALEIEPILPVLGLFLTVGGGFLRTVYALMFESGVAPAVSGLGGPGALSGRGDSRGALPVSHSVPANSYTSPTGSWRDTNDLQATRGSVTDSTTKLLQKDERDQ